MASRLLRSGGLLLLLAAAAAGAWFVYTLLQPLVAVTRPTRGPAVEAVYATGTVEPVDFAKVAPLERARLTQILARDGDKVRKGQVLARLDDREARNVVAQLEVRRDFLKQERDRVTDLYKKNFVSRQALDRAESDLAQVEAQIAAARRGLAETALVSPMPGVVLRQDGEPGEMVNSGQVLYWVGDPNKLRITADVDEEDIPRVKPGQTALIKADAYPEQVLQGTLSEITPKGDPVSKNYRVRIAVPRDTPLRVGMTVEVNLVVRETKDALLVPTSSVSNSQVWLLREGRAERVPVKTGVIGEKLAEVRDGLRGDETVIVAPPGNLKPGARVRVADAPAKQ
ncbi:MAG TPA: efflux RND transporter periplasmic adaptor subunit [Burkholderiales bacterium]|nr:efflux RND transporter periplasmic adaptor subunit [Burkholderiales bacterium]